jgi:archaellum biogenesis protein FlaJ (TadC family)
MARLPTFRGDGTLVVWWSQIYQFAAVAGLIWYVISWKLPAHKQDHQMSQPSSSTRRINWQSVITVLSAAVLIGVEVFGAAFAGGWALANLAGLGDYAPYAQLLLFLGGVAVMAKFIRNGMKVEPFTTPG